MSRRKLGQTAEVEAHVIGGTIFRIHSTHDGLKVEEYAIRRKHLQIAPIPQHLRRQWRPIFFSAERKGEFSIRCSGGEPIILISDKRPAISEGVVRGFKLVA